MLEDPMLEDPVPEDWADDTTMIVVTATAASEIEPRRRGRMSYPAPDQTSTGAVIFVATGPSRASAMTDHAATTGPSAFGDAELRRCLASSAGPRETLGATG
jgi:hypothetical protein